MTLLPSKAVLFWLAVLAADMVGLKLSGLIGWSWVWVLSPIWFYLGARTLVVGVAWRLGILKDGVCKWWP